MVLFCISLTREPPTPNSPHSSRGRAHSHGSELPAGREGARTYGVLMLTAQQAYELVAPLYEGRLDRVGIPEIEHLRFVADGLPEELKPLGWMHDVIEDGLMTYEQAIAAGASETQIATLRHLDRNLHPGSYLDVYISQIAVAPSEAGRGARATKHRDLTHNSTRQCPPHMLSMRQPGGRYWRALQTIEAAMLARGEL